MVFNGLFYLGLFLSNQVIDYFSENNPANKLFILSNMNIDTIECFYLWRTLSLGLFTISQQLNDCFSSRITDFNHISQAYYEH